MTIEIQPEDVTLGRELNAAIARLNGWSNQNTDTRLALHRARLLSLIESRQPAHISDLARADNCSQPGMTVQIQRLEADHLTRRDPDPDDARATRITLTEHGRRLLDETRRARAETMASIIARLDEDSRAGLHSALRQLEHLLTIAADDSQAARSPEI